MKQELTTVSVGDLIKFRLQIDYENPDASDIFGVVIQKEGLRIRVLHNRLAKLINPVDISAYHVTLVSPSS
jgi:hypothetical protein